MTDIVPGLLDVLQKDFKTQYNKSKRIDSLLRVKNKSIMNAYSYAREVGNIQAKVYKNNISSAILPDGKMYYNIANGIIPPTLENDYGLITDYYREAQFYANKKAGISLKAQIAALNLDRVNGFVDVVSSADNFDDTAKVLDKAVQAFAMSIADDCINKNAKFLADAGVEVMLTRSLHGEDNCEFCQALAGQYKRPFPSEMFARHVGCVCTIDFEGKKMRTSGNAFVRNR